MIKPPSAGVLKATFVVFVVALCACQPSRATCPDAFPITQDVELAEWSRAGLARLRQTAEEIGSSTLVIVTRDRRVFSFGDETYPLPVRSIRKSLLNALIGQQVDRGRLNLNAPLSSLTGVDFSELTPVESTARIRDIVASRSGIYLPAAAETKEAAATRPSRGSHAPGERWRYNNWDFNAAGKIYENAAGGGIFYLFQKNIAEPLCMQDYKPGSGSTAYLENVWGVKQSPFPAYHFRMSARDLVRFGQLYLRKGVWEGQRILSEAWVAESTRAISQTLEPIFNGYGYMWWVAGKQEAEQVAKAGLTAGLPEGSYAAAGYGGQWLIVIPAWDTVIVHQTDTRWRPDSRILSKNEKTRLFNAVIGARLKR